MSASTSRLCICSYISCRPGPWAGAAGPWFLQGGILQHAPPHQIGATGGAGRRRAGAHRVADEDGRSEPQDLYEASLIVPQGVPAICSIRKLGPAVVSRVIGDDVIAPGQDGRQRGPAGAAIGPPWLSTTAGSSRRPPSRKCRRTPLLIVSFSCHCTRCSSVCVLPLA